MYNWKTYFEYMEGGGQCWLESLWKVLKKDETEWR